MRKISRTEVLAELRKLRTADFPEPALRRAQALIGEFLAENPRRREPGKRARKTLKHLRSARRQMDGHADSTVRKAARKLVKTAGHPISFEELEGGARKFAGLLKKTGHRREEKARVQEAEWRQVDPDGWLEQVVSVGQLQSVGKQLAVCVAGSKWAHRYFRKVEEGDAELWVYRKDDARYALIEVDADDRGIVGCQTHEGETPDFSAQQARTILAALKASGDDEEAFTRVGAYSAFQGKRPPKTVIFDLGGNRRLRIWCCTDEIIAAVKTSKESVAWTRFRKENDCWEDDWSGCLQLGELFELARTRPDIRERLGFAE